LIRKYFGDHHPVRSHLIKCRKVASYQRYLIAILLSGDRVSELVSTEIFGAVCSSIAASSETKGKSVVIVGMKGRP